MTKQNKNLTTKPTQKIRRKKLNRKHARNKNAFGFYRLRNPASSGLFPRRWVRTSPHRLHLVNADREAGVSNVLLHTVQTNVPAFLQDSNRVWHSIVGAFLVFPEQHWYCQYSSVGIAGTVCVLSVH